MSVAAAPHHQRARGRAALTFAAGPAGMGLRELDQSAPLRLLFPDPDPGEPSIAALVNVAGGLTGGDSAAFALTLLPGGRLTLTTPAAEKVYRSLGPQTEIAVRIDLAEGSVCEWLPQETILFNGARLRRAIDIALAPDARLLAAEMLVLGRAARGEVFTQGDVRDAWRLRRGGRLVWADTLRLDDPAESRVARFGLDGAGHVVRDRQRLIGGTAHRGILPPPTAVARIATDAIHVGISPELLDRVLSEHFQQARVSGIEFSVPTGRSDQCFRMGGEELPVSRHDCFIGMLGLQFEARVHSIPDLPLAEGGARQRGLRSADKKVPGVVRGGFERIEGDTQIPDRRPDLPIRAGEIVTEARPEKEIPQRVAQTDECATDDPHASRLRAQKIVVARQDRRSSRRRGGQLPRPFGVRAQHDAGRRTLHDGELRPGDPLEPLRQLRREQPDLR